MEDEHRLRERTELSLDNRQIFLLFIASAAVVSLVFALGVVVGKRLVVDDASQVRTPPTDPLALLDQMGSNEPLDEELTFHEKLTTGRRTKSADAASPARAAADSGVTPPPRSPPPPPPDRSPAQPVATGGKQAVASTGAGEIASRSRTEQRDRGEVGRRADRAAASAASADPDGTALAAKVKTPQSARKQPQRPGPDLKAEERQTGSETSDAYTLQLSSFQDRAEAERFMARLRSTGLAPHMVPTRIPHRGVWYRVRLGTYRTWDAAMTAKARFEQTQQVIAYVTRKNLGTE